MMREELARLEKLIGEDAIKRLSESEVLVFGVGGVGGYVVESLARSGIGALTIVDADDVALSNINRQIIATHETLGRPKVEVFKERIHSISPDTRVVAMPLFFLPESDGGIDVSEFDYVVDAIDTVKAKVEIAVRCRDAGVPLISAMGCGNRMDPSKLEVTDIFKTSMDPLSKVMRKELRARGVESLKVVYSTEEPIRGSGTDARTPGSSAFVPPAAGLMIASEIVRSIVSPNQGERR